MIAVVKEDRSFICTKDTTQTLNELWRNAGRWDAKVCYKMSGIW